MKKIKNTQKTNFLKKIFIKLSRLLGFEIIDQSNFSSPTLNKDLTETLSIQGKKSITIPLGQIDIKNKINSLKIIVRTCTSELIMDQNKRRIFDEEKNEYTFRTLRSLIKSINKASLVFKNIKFDLIVTDTNSPKEDINKIQEILNKYSPRARHAKKATVELNGIIYPIPDFISLFITRLRFYLRITPKIDLFQL